MMLNEITLRMYCLEARVKGAANYKIQGNRAGRMASAEAAACLVAIHQDRAELEALRILEKKVRT
jgi:hypothetical protein